MSGIEMEMLPMHQEASVSLSERKDMRRPRPSGPSSPAPTFQPLELPGTAMELASVPVSSFREAVLEVGLGKTVLLRDRLRELEDAPLWRGSKPWVWCSGGTAGVS